MVDKKQNSSTQGVSASMVHSALSTQNSTSSHFSELPKSVQPVCFHDVSYEKVRKFFDHAFDHLARKRKLYTQMHDRYGRELPKIVITPPSENAKRVAQKSLKQHYGTHLLEIKDAQHKDELESLEKSLTHRYAKLIADYEQKVSDLKLQIKDLHLQVARVTSELKAHTQLKTHHTAFTYTISDFETELAHLEHKILHFSHKEKKYAELAARLSNAKLLLEQAKS
jgi:hypothetical protein